MTALLEYQSAFATALLAGDATPPLSLFQGPPSRRVRGFKIHANNRMHALVSALGATFPAVRGMLGKNMFTAVAVGYVRAHPPAREALLIWYGRHFPVFLEKLEGLAPYLPDLARLEYAWLEAYHAAEAEPLTAAHVASLVPEQLVAARLHFHPSVRLLRSFWAIDRIWRGDFGIAANGECPAENGAGARCLVVARPFAEVRVLPVSSPVFDCLGGLCEGTLFGDAIDHLDQAEAVAELQALIAAGLFAAVDIQA